MIICAAMNVTGFKDNGEDLIVPCFRHGDGYVILRSLCKDDSYKRNTTEGFITHEGKFLNGIDAYNHAWACGQLSMTTREEKGRNGENELYGEDLY